MAKYIAVLNSDLKKTYWKAVQWDDDLESLVANPHYTAGVNQQMPKSDGDVTLQTKYITERITLAKGKATVIKVAAGTSKSLEIAANKGD